MPRIQLPSPRDAPSSNGPPVLRLPPPPPSPPRKTGSSTGLLVRGGMGAAYGAVVGGVPGAIVGFAVSVLLPRFLGPTPPEDARTRIYRASHISPGFLRNAAVASAYSQAVHEAAAGDGQVMSLFWQAFPWYQPPPG